MKKIVGLYGDRVLVESEAGEGARFFHAVKTGNGVKKKELQANVAGRGRRS